MKKGIVKTIDYTTGELNEEINLRARHLAESILDVNTPAFRKPMSRIRVYTEMPGESMTQQAHADSCDINNIIRQYDRTGQLPPNPRNKQPMFADVTALNKDLTVLYSDMQEIGVRIRAAQKALAEKKQEERNAPPPTPPIEPKPEPSQPTP